MFKKISVVGLGYIGLPTAAMFASRKVEVVGVDVDPVIVNTVNAGKIHIKEPGLESLVNFAVKDGYLKASLHLETADAFLICVPTPFEEDYKPHLAYIEAAVKNIAPFLQKGNLVIIESTCPVGTTEKLIDWFGSLRPDLRFPQNDHELADINLAHCPERVLPGNVLRELIENDRIIGGITKNCSDRATELYSAFVTGECIKTDARTAEMAKLTENSFRDVNIAFANELSILCDKFKIDVYKLIDLANRHPRVNILKPGPGVGGHCIAVDPWFIVHSGGEKARIIRTAREINDQKTDWVISQISNEIEKFEKKYERQPVVACMGLSFKPDIDDLRESPALKIFYALKNNGVDVLAVEPNLKKHKSILLIDYKNASYKADILIFLVAHREFKNFETSKIVLDFSGANIGGQN